MLAAIPSDKPEPLPELREDLVFADAGFDVSGERGVVVYDPLQHSFIRLSSSAAALLEHFRTSSAFRSASVLELATFLQSARLVKPKAGMAAHLSAEHLRRQKSLASQFLHNYISFRIPLFNPEPFLDWSMPVVRQLASKTLFICVLMFTVIGAYFASRQWDHFVTMLQSSFSLAGAAGFAVTVVILKIFHELGHAFVARHFGCRVPSIGIAFMVLTPMLYTDASDAWRLSSRRQRMLIGAAGIFVELSIAAAALFLWAILPDGPARGVAFFVAVSAWMMSLLVNLSPFMRFDGYHILVDAMGMHSLGPRSFALANWRLREFLFKPDDPPPEFFAPGLRKFLVGFAFATWIYRLSLFLGIAYLIYTMFPKAAGIPLAAVEVHFFILRPVLRELKEWKTMGLKRLLLTQRAFFTLGVCCFGLVLALLPLDRHVHVPAVFLPADEARLYPSEPAQVAQVNVKPGDRVAEGQILAQLVVPDIGHQQQISQLRLEVSEGRLQRIAADAKDLSELRVLEQQRGAALAELEGLRQRGAMLVVRAPISGILSGDASKLREGQWVAGNELLFHISNPDRGKIVGLVAEREAGRLGRGAVVSFVAEDGLRKVVFGTVEEAGLPGSEGIAASYLSSQFGGPVIVNPSSKGGFEPMTGQIPLLIKTDGVAPEVAVTGTAVISADPQSFAGYLLGRIVIVVMRESGF